MCVRMLLSKPTALAVAPFTLAFFVSSIAGAADSDGLLDAGALALEPSPGPVAPPCVPSCREGFVCINAQCVSACNPPCASNQICTAAGVCNFPSGPPNVSAPTASLMVPSEPTPVVTTMAESFGRGPHIALSAENLMGFRHEWYTRTPSQFQGSSISNAEVTGTSNQFTLLGSNNAANIDAKMALDYVFPTGFTLGGVFIYATTSADLTVTHNANRADFKDPSQSSVGFGARLGYVYMFNKHWGIWPRLGLHYLTTTATRYSYTYIPSTGGYAESREDADADYLELDPELMFIVTPVPHFAFLFGARSSLPLTGSYSRNVDGTVEEKGDDSYGNVAVVAGLMGYL